MGSPGLFVHFFFLQFFWLIFPIMGMGFGFFAIWKRHQQHQRALDVLRVYAEKGQEPPASVLEALRAPLGDYRAEWGDGRGYRRGRNGLSRAALFGVLAAGFFFAAFAGHHVYAPSLGFFIVACVFTAIGASSLVRGLMSRGRDDQ